ncbi:MAG: hypothetical protein M1829_003528 [Trizodia sp. TS-e1964]|nr:MAG: hypothetical protein M1829_003528 [Trizodia sp. TS-e1964]
MASSTIFSSTPSLPISRNSSQATNTSSNSAIFARGASVTSSAIAVKENQQNDLKHIVLRSFVPHIAIRASADTDEIAREKGFTDGLLEILRPFGEHVQGKVTIRDSTGASRSWEDFAIRFIAHGTESSHLKTARDTAVAASVASAAKNGLSALDNKFSSLSLPSSGTGGDIVEIEHLIARRLEQAETIPQDSFTGDDDQTSSLPSPYYLLYVKKLLSSMPLSPHETFSYPVACIVAISSRTPNPIEVLRQLYAETNQGNQKLPYWANSEYLRYYVLVHDEEKDDIRKSSVLFDQMKRHFGLHCHLLILRSSRCVPSDDDSHKMPTCTWTSAAEDTQELLRRESSDEDGEDFKHFLFESDITSIQTFVRGLVTSSVIPYMERCVSTWNDQVASRRRGIGGRFISLSKKWTGFGSSTKSGTGLGLNGSPGGSNYDPVQQFYRPEAPEAVMRKLGDFAFMLRDWKLAQGVYDLLRTDYSNDKAWKYQAGANEMTALSSLLLATQSPTAYKPRPDSVDQLLETASYSYNTRCLAPYYALRCLTVGFELLKLRPTPSGAEDAAKWAMRVLETNVLGAIGEALYTERIAGCYASAQQTRAAGPTAWHGGRRRKAAFWKVLATDAWLKIEKAAQAEGTLRAATKLYDAVDSAQYSGKPPGSMMFEGMQTYIEDLRYRLRIRGRGLDLGSEGGLGGILDGELVDTVVGENLDHGHRRNHRRSIAGSAGGLVFEELDHNRNGLPATHRIPSDADDRDRDDF